MCQQVLDRDNLNLLLGFLRGIAAITTLRAKPDDEGLENGEDLRSLLVFRGRLRPIIIDGLS